MGGGGSFSGLLMLTVIGPVTEEIMKIAAALWVVERRPYLFKSIPQILLCAVAGGLAFAFIENLMYLNVYIPHHTPKLELWRWTVCVGLHSGCSFVAGVGLARIWDNAVRELRRPQLGLGMPWFFTAMVGHGLYNGGVTLAETFDLLKFDTIQ
jgi:RsiW-degrading membrane proteinase PrsW (M82 family)